MKIRQAIPSVITLCAMALGILSILLAVEGMRTAAEHSLYRLSAILIMVAMILDGLDGNLARYLKATSEFGSELDTYVDLTAFGISPAVLIFTISSETSMPWRLALPLAVCLSGVVRLARFKATDPLRGQGGYAGLPITVNAGWIALSVFISQTPQGAGFWLDHSVAAFLFFAGVMVCTVLQVTKLRYPKPTKNGAFFSVCCLVVALFLCLGLDGDLSSRYSVTVAMTMISLGALYVAGGPLFVRRAEAHRARGSAGRGEDSGYQGMFTGPLRLLRWKRHVAGS